MYYSIGAPGRKHLVRAKRKAVLLKTRLLSKFCTPKGTVFDFHLGTQLTAKAYLQALDHFKMFECRVNNVNISKAMLSSLELFARQVLNVAIDTNDSEEIQDVVKITCKEISTRWSLYERICDSHRENCCAHFLTSPLFKIAAIFLQHGFVPFWEASALHFMKH